MLTFELMNMYSVLFVIVENEHALFYPDTIIICCVVLNISVSTNKLAYYIRMKTIEQLKFCYIQFPLSNNLFVVKYYLFNGRKNNFLDLSTDYY